MFKAISHWIFGGEHEAQGVVRPGELEEEGWLLVNHQEAIGEGSSAEDRASTCAKRCPLDPSVIDETDAKGETDRILESGALVENGTSGWLARGSGSQAGVLSKAAQAARVQRAQAWEDRRRLARSCIQRQNCVHQRAKRLRCPTQNPFLHQPQ